MYQGAPTPVTAFFSVGSKAAGFVILIRLMEPFLGSELLNGNVIFVLVIIAGGHDSFQ